MKAKAFWMFCLKLMGEKSNKVPKVVWNNLYDSGQNLQDFIMPIQLEEITSVINTWPSNKSPGPNSFTGKFYKLFKDILISDLYRVFTYVLENGSRLDTLSSSYIVLIPKKEEAKTLGFQTKKLASWGSKYFIQKF